MTRLLLLLVLLLPLPAPAQIGLHPPRQDWQQLTVDNTRILFPAGYEARARRVASLIERMDADHSGSVGQNRHRVDLVLQTENLTINGYVGLGPFRSEFFTTGPQGLGLLSASDWLDLLTVHEYRHVQQNSNERRGLTKFFSYLQGQEAWGAFSSIAVPNWFTEGDAVIMETALTPLGRGRTPAFHADLRSLLTNDIVYPYAKARNGSFRDLVPDHYRYGYAMLSRARTDYGPDFWRPVFQEAAAYRGLFYPFSQALKRRTGEGTRAYYRSTMAELEQRVDSALLVRGPLTEGTPLTADRRGVWNYRFPILTAADRLYALRNGYQRLPEVVRIDRRTGAERAVARVGIQREPWLDVSERFALWTEVRQHPRYTNESFSELIVRNLSSGRQRQLTSGGHYLSARLSPDQLRIAAVSFESMDGYPELVVLSTVDGSEQARHRLPGTMAAWPAWLPGGATVRFFSLDLGGVGVYDLDLASGATAVVLPRTARPLDMLTVTRDGRTLLSGGQDGIDNIYELGEGGELRALTNVAVGAYYPTAASGDTLYYVAQTPTGLRPRQLTVRPLPAPAGKRRTVSVFERPAAYLAEGSELSTTTMVKDYPISNFSNTFGGIKLHSWSYNGSYVNPGLEVAATNALNTVAFRGGVAYNINEDRYSVGATASYGGLFPVLGLTARSSDRNTIVQLPRRDSFRLAGQEFSQLLIAPEVSVPLRWVAGNFRTALRPSVALQLVSISGGTAERRPASFTGLGTGLTVSILQRMAVQHVQPRWGALSQLAYDRGLGDGGANRRFLARNALYLPGLFPTHGIRLDADFQAEPAEALYQYPDRFRYARGFSAPLNDRVWRLGANYQLPLLYPDLGLWGLTYFKRIRLNAFYDYSRFTIDNFQNRGLTLPQASVGGELFFDNVWLNTQDLSFGVQFAYLLEPDVFSSRTNRLRVELLVAGSF